MFVAFTIFFFYVVALLSIDKIQFDVNNLFNIVQTRKDTELERFISSKNPTNAAEVDYWIREYDRKVVTE